MASSAPVDCEPDVGLVPDQAPDASHAVALDDDHVSVDAAPLATVVGSARSVTVVSSAVLRQADSAKAASAADATARSHRKGST